MLSYNQHIWKPEKKMQHFHGFRFTIIQRKSKRETDSRDSRDSGSERGAAATWVVITGQWAHHVLLKIKGDLHFNLTQGTALELPPLICLAGGTAITKCSSEIPNNFIQQLLLIDKETDEGGAKNSARRGERQREKLLYHLHIHLSSWVQT